MAGTAAALPAVEAAATPRPPSRRWRGPQEEGVPVTTTTATPSPRPSSPPARPWQVQPAAEGEGEEGDHHGDGAAEEVAHVAVEVAEDHADDERQDGADQRRPGKGREPGDAEGDHGEEGAGFKRHDRVGADVARLAVLAHQRHVEPAVGVVHRGHDGEGGESRRRCRGHRRLAQDLADDDADQDGDAHLHAEAACRPSSGCRAWP